MPSSALDEGIQDLFAGQTRRLRLRQALRGTGLTILILVALYLLVLGLDRAFEPGSAWMRLGFTAWCAVALLASSAFLLLPLRRRFSHTTLAAALEQTHPELGERLLSALTADQESAARSTSFVTHLLAETAAQSRGLDYRRSVALRSSLRLFGVSAVLLLLVAGAVLGWDASQFNRRFWLSWFSWQPPYRLEVEAGPGFVVRGKAYPVKARLVRLQERGPLPRQGFFVYHTGARPAVRVPLTLDKEQQLAFTLESPQEALTFFFEAGEATSGIHELKIVDPVDLADGGLQVEIVPPSYVEAAVHPKETHAGNKDFSVLQYSVLHWQFTFTRPAVDGALTLSIKSGAADVAPLAMPLHWAADRRSAQASMPAAWAGTFSGILRLTAEHDVMREVPLPAVAVWADLPPQFLAVSGQRDAGTEGKAAWVVVPNPAGSVKLVQEVPELDRAPSATPDEHLHLKISAEDQVGLDRIDIEYRVNQGAVKTATLWRGAGKTQVHTDIDFPLQGKVKEGDVFLYRLVAVDNRVLKKGQIWPRGPHPDRDLGPQTAVEPPSLDGKDRWLALKIQKQAPPLYQQEILAERDDIRKRLGDIKKKIESERFQLEKLRLEVHRQPIFTQDQAAKLSGLRKQNQEVCDDLASLAIHVSRNPFLQALAGLLSGLAEGEMSRSDRSLNKGQDRSLANPVRDQHLEQADRELAQALKKLQELEQVNERLAVDRLDQMHLATLAQKQEDLTLKAAELAKHDPLSPEVQKALAKLKEEQDQLAKELAQLTRKSQLFQDALKQAAALHLKKLGDKAEMLAHAQRDLAMAKKDTQDRELRSLLAELAQKQEDLARRAVKFLDGVKAAQPAFLLPVPFAEAGHAAAALRQARVEDALHFQQVSAEKLGGVALDLSQRGLIGRDPRTIVARLAKAQEKLYRDLERLAQDFGRVSPKELQRRLLELAGAEKRLYEALQKMDLPQAAAKAQAERKQVLALLAEIADLLPRDPLSAFLKMEKAPAVLGAFAQVLPSAPSSADLKDKISSEEKWFLEQGLQAHKLEQEQIELRKELLKLLAQQEKVGPGDNPAARLIQLQKEITDKTAQLAAKLDPKAQKTAPPKIAQEAAQLTKKTLNEAQVGAFGKAGETAEKAAKELHELAQAMDKEQAQDKKLSQEALDLAKQQALLAKDWKKLADDLDAQKAQQLARQKDLLGDAKGLSNDLQMFSQKDTPESKQAAMAAEKAKEAMEEGPAKLGTPEKASAMADDAAKQLDNSAELAFAAARKMQGKETGLEQAGESLMQSRQQLDEAKNMLAKSQPQSAQKAMNKAAQSLEQAAQAVAKAMNANPKMYGQTKNTNQPGPSGSSVPQQVDLLKYGAQSWGELPGELRTRLVQDLRARYGEEYAALIQSYFEQIADTGANKAKR